MTAVASPPSFPQVSRSAWGTIDGNAPMNADEVRGMFAPRKPIARSNSSSSISSTGSTSSNTTVATNGSQSANGTSVSTTSDTSQWSANTAQRKRPQPKAPWPPGRGEAPQDFSRMSAPRPNGMSTNAALPSGPGQQQLGQQQMIRPPGPEQFPPGQPVLFLLSLNGTFERKTIAVPFAPENLRIGRQTNQKTVPTPMNGYFDSKVLSRQHAEIYAERNGKIYIRDVKSSNGTFVNGQRLSQENRESEPHELQTADHLELGIDIVSEDQKTVVHHKVAAKVEHAGFMSSPNNVMDMNFGDLDPANGMMPGGGMHYRGRQGSNASMGSNGRMANGMGMNGQLNGMQQRPFFLTPVATDQILKRLNNEMRSARIQAQDLSRTNQLINALLSKDDLKDMEREDGAVASKSAAMVNGNGLPFRPDTKARFSDPPAPPPQAPLPEKPDVPSLKRGPTERPRSGAPLNPSSPVRQENVSQIIQLTEALNNAKRDIDSQSARMRELEIMLQQERAARELAEDLAKRLEETAHSPSNAVTKGTEVVENERALNEADHSAGADIKAHPGVTKENARPTAVELQSRIDMMDSQMQDMRKQMDQWKQRCEVAESERDADRKTLAEMVIQLRAEEARRVAQEKGRSRSRRRRGGSRTRDDQDRSTSAERGILKGMPEESQVDGAGYDEFDGDPTLSRTNTITPTPAMSQNTLQGHGSLQSGLPYASMMGVVLIGMGLMAYINGWQAPPPRVEQ